MKKATLAILAFVLIAGGSILIFGQRGDGRRGGMRGGFGGPGILRMAEKLGLTEEQKTQIKQILEESRTRVEPLMQAARTNHEQIRELGKDGTFNEAEVNRLAGLQAENTRQMIVEKERTKAAIFAILTPEQRVKAGEMRKEFGERFKNRRGPGFRPGREFDE